MQTYDVFVFSSPHESGIVQIALFCYCWGFTCNKFWKFLLFYSYGKEITSRKAYSALNLMNVRTTHWCLETLSREICPSGKQDREHNDGKSSRQWGKSTEISNRTQGAETIKERIIVSPIMQNVNGILNQMLWSTNSLRWGCYNHKHNELYQVDAIDVMRIHQHL